LFSKGGTKNKRVLSSKRTICKVLGKGKKVQTICITVEKGGLGGGNRERSAYKRGGSTGGRGHKALGNKNSLQKGKRGLGERGGPKSPQPFESPPLVFGKRNLQGEGGEGINREQVSE